MPKNIDPDATVSLPCPRCGEKSQQTIATLQLSPRIRCSACGTQFAVDAKKILQRVKEAQEKIDLAHVCAFLRLSARNPLKTRERFRVFEKV